MDAVNFFQENGYAKHEHALSKDVIDLVSQYAIFDELQNKTIGDTQVPLAHSKYADPCMEAVLLKLHPLLEKITQLCLIPTYSYYRVYRSGDELLPHTDRPACEISATLSFNYTCQDPWPIFMNDKEVNLQPGDLAVYRGCEISHYRNKLICGPDDHHIQGFFHYVDSNGPFKEHAFDKRDCIGIKKEHKNYIIRTQQ